MSAQETLHRLLSSTLMVCTLGAFACSQASEGSSVSEFQGECGVKGQPDCPTQEWMKSTLQAYVRSRDYDRLKASFLELGASAPAEFTDWGSISKVGAEAAGRQDLSGVKATCKSCHDRYRDEFKHSMRKRIFLR